MDRYFRPACIIAAAALLGWAGWRWTRDRLGAPTIRRAISYAPARGDAAASGKTLDLYLAAGKRRRALIAIAADPGTGVPFEESLAESLARAGVHAAVVRLPGGGKEAGIALVEALGFLKRNATVHGHDSARMFVAGRGAAGRVSAAVGADPDRAGLDAADLAGVIIIGTGPNLSAAPTGSGGGVTPGGEESDRWPRSRVGRSADGRPPFLLLSGERDPAGSPVEARRFADALRASGHSEVTHIVAPGRNYREAARWEGTEDHLGHRLILSFVDASPLPPGLVMQLSAERRWRTAPPVSTEAFWETAPVVDSFPVDDHFVNSLRGIFEGRENELRTLPLERYHAIDLLRFLTARGSNVPGEGGFLVVTNLLGQQLVLSRRELVRFRPRLVIGIDDERNLFRYVVGYQTRRDESWNLPGGAPRPQLVRPLGAFLHLPGVPASRLFAPTVTRFGLHAGSFRWETVDPLADVREVEGAVRDALLRTPACLECHSFRGAGARSRHLEAFTGEPAAGTAEPLESYPPEVMRRFLFDQEAVAREIGVKPVVLGPELARRLHELVAAER